MNPPNVAQTMLKLSTAKVGMPGHRTLNGPSDPPNGYVGFFCLCQLLGEA
jgi:hypothetical protein